jgi:hypothetical protein
MLTAIGADLSCFYLENQLFQVLNNRALGSKFPNKQHEDQSMPKIVFSNIRPEHLVSCNRLSWLVHPDNHQ